MAFEAMGRPFESDRAYEESPTRRHCIAPHLGGQKRSQVQKCELRTQDTPQVRNPIKPPSQSGERAFFYSAGLAAESSDAELLAGSARTVISRADCIARLRPRA
jgi:hypothetical protein